MSVVRFTVSLAWSSHYTDLCILFKKMNFLVFYIGNQVVFMITKKFVMWGRSRTHFWLFWMLQWLMSTRGSTQHQAKVYEVHYPRVGSRRWSANDRKEKVCDMFEWRNQWQHNNSIDKCTCICSTAFHDASSALCDWKKSFKRTCLCPPPFDTLSCCS